MEGQGLRDISIIYQDLTLQTKVELRKIVCEFFKHHLKEFNNQFQALAQKAKTPSFIPLVELKHYDVTLNTTVKGASSVMNNAGISFESYDKKKALRFYVHDLQSNKGNEEEQNDRNIIFCLIRGTISEREQSVDITDMKYDQFQKKMREIFSIDPTMPIKYKNMRDGSFFNLTDANKPINIINQMRISKVGIYPVYEAGGV